MKLPIKICIILLAFCFIGISFVREVKSPVYATELGDLNTQINQKEKEKKETLNKIKAIQAQIDSLSKNTKSLSQLLADYKSQKTDLDAQVATLKIQIEEQEKTLAEFSAKLDERKEEIQKQINYLYKLSYNNPNSFFSSTGDLEEFFDAKAELNYSIELNKLQIKDFYDKIDKANAIKEQSKKDIESSQATITDLDSKIASTQQQLASANSALAAANGNKAKLVSISNELNNQLRFLSAQQKALLDAELAKVNANKQTNQTVLQPGQYYFTGIGRDLIEGHGLGMSQWGMYGMAQKGWTYNQILTFYYSGTAIGDYKEPEKIRVTGKESVYPPEAQARGYLTIDEYLSGIGEVPNSWPAEAVKAQVVAARTYVMGTCGAAAECTICGTASCQVYNGGMGKQNFVASTKGKVILYNGAPIVAYYSASHRGYSTSLNSAWGSSDLPYIKPVNDDAYAYKDYQSDNPYYTATCNCPAKIKSYNWRWRTNGYTLEQLSDIFKRDSRLNVGNLTNIQIQLDAPKKRVARITLIGSAGTKSLTGWTFRSVFNAVTPYNDYVYSTEFGFYQN